jgi:putative transposase
MNPGRILKSTPPRLSVLFDPQPLFFVTFNTLHRRRLLDNASVHTAFRDYAARGLELGAAVGRYILMPDHVHAFVRLAPGLGLGAWVRGLKRQLGTMIEKQGVRPYVLSGMKLSSLWQPGFFDHVLRHDESYASKWYYVRENPVRKGLVDRAEDWPYQGEIAGIDRA